MAFEHYRFHRRFSFLPYLEGELKQRKRDFITAHLGCLFAPLSGKPFSAAAHLSVVFTPEFLSPGACAPRGVGATATSAGRLSMVYNVLQARR